MIRLGEAAQRQLDALLEHYVRLGRLEASQSLVASIDQAMAQVERNPAAGLLAPRPYPQLAAPGEAWVKAGRYWVSYSTTSPPVILAVFHDTADIPGRQPL